MSLENPCTFLLAKEKTSKRTFSINSELSQNHTEKQIMLFKTTVNWLFNDVWCYLVIAFFYWKIGVQQTVVSVYCIRKSFVLRLLSIFTWWETGPYIFFTTFYNILKSRRSLNFLRHCPIFLGRETNEFIEICNSPIGITLKPWIWLILLEIFHKNYFFCR